MSDAPIHGVAANGSYQPAADIGVAKFRTAASAADQGPLRLSPTISTAVIRTRTNSPIERLVSGLLPTVRHDARGVPEAGPRIGKLRQAEVEFPPELALS
jgi:hypothetical protein